MKQTIELEKAAKILERLAEQRKRWGKHAGYSEFTEAEVMDALIAIHDAGLLNLQDDTVKLREELTLSNRQKGAAEARATRYKNDLDKRNKDYEELVLEFEKEEHARKFAQTQLRDARAEILTLQETLNELFEGDPDAPASA